MKNAQDLRKTLSNVTQKLISGEMTSKDASAVANLAGKMIASAKAQIENYSLLGEKVQIEFLRESANPTSTPKPK
jgi:hypothetical protein